jgi:STE24 endopeptidase
MPIDPRAETARYVDSLGPQALEQTREYTANGQWLIFGGLVTVFIVAWMIARSGILDRLGARFESGPRIIRTLVLCATALTMFAILSMPWRIWSSWAFKSSYGRTTQPLIDFLLQDLIQSSLLVVAGSVFYLAVYTLMSHAGRRWWLWSGEAAPKMTGQDLTLV